MQRNFLRAGHGAVVLAGAAEFHRVGGEDLGVATVGRHTDAVAFASDRAEVADHDDLVTELVDSAEADDALLIVIQHNPLEAVPGIVHFPEFGVVEVEFVELPVEVLELVVHRIFEQVPVELLLVIPLVKLTELRAHEAELLAGMRHDIGHERTQSGKFHIVVAGHLLEQGRLAVHHFVVGQREDEMLGESIHQREGKQVVIVGTVNRIHREVTQRIVHPAHVPLEGKAETAVRGVARYLRPCGGFLRDHHGVGIILLDHRVEHLEEFDGFEVFVSAVDVGHPFAVAAVVVEIEHRGDRVHAQTVDVIFVEPEQRVGDQEGTHLIASEIEHAGTPFLMFALAPVGIFIGRRAVEAIQTVRILREVGGYPVHNHADAVFMQDIHKAHEFLGFAVTGGRRVITRDLIAP